MISNILQAGNEYIENVLNLVVHRAENKLRCITILIYYHIILFYTVD